MGLNKITQYSLLFCLYLARAGRANVKDIAANLSLPKRFLEQIARKLKLAGVVNSVRGPGGGYSLVEGIKIIQIINAVTEVSLLTKTEHFNYIKGQPEERALALYTSWIGSKQSTMLNMTVTNVMEVLVKAEMHTLDNKNLNGMDN